MGIQSVGTLDKRDIICEPHVVWNVQIT